MNTNLVYIKISPHALEKIAPKKEYYAHHNTWNEDNGYSHIRASIIDPSITLPICNKKLFMELATNHIVELDTKHRTHDLIIQIVGD